MQLGRLKQFKARGTLWGLPKLLRSYVSTFSPQEGCLPLLSLKGLQSWATEGPCTFNNDMNIDWCLQQKG